MKQTLIVILIFLCSCQSKLGNHNSKYENLINEINSIANQEKFSGVITLSQGTKPIYSKAYGYSNLDKKTIMKTDDLFVIGSISKQITAVLVLKEYENGKIQLEDKISKYLPDISQPWSKKVTIHQLLTHTHGISNINEPLQFPQGSQFKYSQLGYELLAQILEKVTGTNFREHSEIFFKKHKLSNTFHPENKTYRKRL